MKHGEEIIFIRAISEKSHSKTWDGTAILYISTPFTNNPSKRTAEGVHAIQRNPCIKTTD